MKAKYKIIYTEHINGEQVSEKTIEFFYKSKMLSMYQNIIDTSNILLNGNISIQEEESVNGRILKIVSSNGKYSMVRQYQMCLI